MTRRLALTAWLLISAFFCPAYAAKTSDPSMRFFVMEESSTRRMFREVLRNGAWDIYADGNITEGTAARFERFVREKRIEYARVHFHSPGGNLLEGLRLGASIRKLGFDTDVSRPSAKALCASACAYAFAGGAGRFLDPSRGMIGLHQFSSSSQHEAGMALTQALSAVILSYLSEMGVKANAYVMAALAAPNTIHWLTEREAADSDFVNNGIRPTSAEIRVVDLHPYLRLEQNRHSVTVRILITCIGRSAELAVGLVTTPELSREHAFGNNRSYVDVDGEEALPIGGDAGLEANNHVLWVRRPIDSAFLRRLRNAKSLGAHAYRGGLFTWGDSLDLTEVREKVGDYVDQCQISVR